MCHMLYLFFFLNPLQSKGLKLEQQGWGGEEDALWPGRGSDKPAGPSLTHPTPNLCSQAQLSAACLGEAGAAGTPPHLSPHRATRPAPAPCWESGPWRCPLLGSPKPLSSSGQHPADPTRGLGLRFEQMSQLLL